MLSCFIKILTVRRHCLGINFDNLLDTIRTSPIMMEDKMKPRNLNSKSYPKPQTLDLNLNLNLKIVNLFFKLKKLDVKTLTLSFNQ